MLAPDATRFLAREARALLARLMKVRPFAMTMPTVEAASVPPAAWDALESHLLLQRRALKRRVRGFLRWLASPEGRAAPPDQQQRAFTFLKLRFNAALDQGDIFADVLTQRTEHETGTWLAGLDVLAADALRLPPYYDAPPVVTYIDRGHGAAIRRARTRLPGGSLSPIAIVRVPRERMIGSGVGGSLVHEVGHQAQALLGLVDSVRSLLRQLQARAEGPERVAWMLWDRWISEIIPDFWSIAQLGVSATTGLIGVVSLPRAFVFRIATDDPHPFPWIRVQLSAAMGWSLYPDPQWRRLAATWERLYPIHDLPQQTVELIGVLRRTMPRLAELIADHRPDALRGRSLREALPVLHRQPFRLRALYGQWQRQPARVYAAAPTLVFAAFGQAAADGRIAPEAESFALERLLRRWAVVRSLPPGVRRAAVRELAATTKAVTCPPVAA